MLIEFAGEANELYDRCIEELKDVYVEATGARALPGSQDDFGRIPAFGPIETLEGFIVGIDRDAGWAGTLRIAVSDPETNDRTGEVISFACDKVMVW